MLKPIAYFINLILVLQNERLILLADHDSLEFLPRLKTKTFGFLTHFARLLLYVFVIFG